MNGTDRSRRRLELAQGKRALATHDPVTAMRLLRSVVDSCPAGNRSELSLALYWLAVALRRLGKDGLAIKALSSAQRLAPRGSARRAYERVANGYGMPRSDCGEHDDYRAFCSIHIRRYLERSPSGRFSSPDEMETVLGIIAGAWLRNDALRRLSESSCGDKLDAFREVEIDFPNLTEADRPKRGSTIPVDFLRGKRLAPASACSCGSGLPYAKCCGRVRMPYES